MTSTTKQVRRDNRDEKPHYTEGPMAGLRELNARELIFIQGMAKGMKIEDAAVAAGYSKQTAANKIAPFSETARPGESVRAHWRALMAGAGLHDEVLMEHMKAGLNGMAHAVTKDGDVVTLGEDWANRAKFLDMALKVTDAYPNPRLDVDARVAATIVVRAEDMLAPDPFADAIDVTPG